MAVVNEKKKLNGTVNQEANQPVIAQSGNNGGKLSPNMNASTYAQLQNNATKPKTNGGSSGLTGVSTNTAQQLASAQTGYQSPYSLMMSNIMQQIVNPQGFNYEFNADPMFQAYSDMYTQQGKQASLDAQAQAAALTGGYGNSYGAAAGNQAYQQWLTQLYDKGMELYDRAYDRYKNDWNQTLQQYDVLNAADQQGYNQWLNNLNYWTQLGQAENQDYYNAQNLTLSQQEQAMQQALQQWQMQNGDQQLALQQQQFEYAQAQDAQNYAYQLCASILANGHMPSAALLAAAGISAEDAAAMMAVLQATGGSGGSGGSGGDDRPGDTEKPNNHLSGTPYNVATSEVQANNLAHNQDVVSSIQQNLNNMPSSLQQGILQAAQNTLSNPNTSQAVQNLINATTNGVNSNSGNVMTQGKPNIGTYNGWSSKKKKD